MRKYLEIAKIGWKSILAYRFDIFSSALFSIGKIFLAYLMWKAVFGTRTEIGGYTFNMMLTYYIIITLLAKLDQSQHMAGQFAEEIRSGYFTKYVVRPVNPLGYFISMSFSRASYLFFVNALTTVLWIGIFKDFFVFPANLAVLGWAALIFILGLSALTLFNYLLAILSFWVLEISSFLFLKQILLEFFNGELIPLHLLPLGVVGLLKYTPFYYTLYFPTTLYLNQQVSEIPTAITVLVVWNILLLVGNHLLYKKAIKSYAGVGI